MLPNEAHGYRARESIMTMLAESNDWLETWVRNSKPAAAANDDAGPQPAAARASGAAGRR